MAWDSMSPVDKQSISSSVFKLATNMGQMFGLILMELAFSLAIPQLHGGKGVTLKSLSSGELMNGFSWAYVAGGIMCLIAILLSLFIREEASEVTGIEETAFLG